MDPKSHLYIALPAMSESRWIPGLIDSLLKQSFKNFSLFICVNQPDDWHVREDKQDICEDNARTISLLEKISDFPVRIIDRTSRGRGWKGKHFGVGWARKTVMDAIAETANDHDIILTMDGDTVFNPSYLESVIDSISSFPKAMGMTIPYYHKLTGSAGEDRAILRYEIYMRHYLLNLFRIGNPYGFTALGSAIAVPVWAYSKVGGITPFKSGEDFYFVQKLRKAGRLVIHNEEKVFPAARFSDRVFFGTGPAMIKGAGGDWNSYPVYDHRLFDLVKQTFDLFPDLYIKNVPTPMDDFLQKQFRETYIWESLRRNAASVEKFVKLCVQKVDALRILQFIKQNHASGNTESDEWNLIDYLRNFYPDPLEELFENSENFSFTDSPVEHLDRIRNFLVEKEDEYRKKLMVI